MVDSNEKITFSFGENWKSFLKTVDEESIRSATADIVEWLGRGGDKPLSDKTVLDIGCGSGIHSMSFHMLGAKRIFSFDYDLHSVEATKQLWEKAGRPPDWEITRGSILDRDFIGRLPKFDVVYSWGVLHHTGAMWEAIGNSIELLNEGGLWWISLYSKGPRYEKDLSLKKRYNAASAPVKRWMEYRYKILPMMKERLRAGQNPFTWNQKITRGMNTYHDIVDWLGGLPYEVASADEVEKFARGKGLVPEKIEPKNEGVCGIYLFSLPARGGRTG